MSKLVKFFLIMGKTLMSLSCVNANSTETASSKESYFTVAVHDKNKSTKRDPLYLFIQEGEESKDPSFPVKLTDSMVELLNLSNLYDETDSFSEVVKKTQKEWLQLVQGRSTQATDVTKGSIERRDLKDSPKLINIKEKVENIARSMGLFDSREASFSSYKYGAWLGAFLPAVRNNLQNLAEAWKKGYRFEKLVVFTGERDLRKEDGQVDDIKNLCDPRQSTLPFKPGWKLPENFEYKTEYDMMKLVFDQVELPQSMAEALRGKVEFINTPKGSNPRPGTKDCYAQWLKTNPEPGRILAVSYPLFWVAQQLGGEAIFGDSHPLDTIAPAPSAEELKEINPALVSRVHDTCAKCLYEIGNQLKARHAPMSPN